MLLSALVGVFKSPPAAVVVSSLVFGLMHAPAWVVEEDSSPLLELLGTAIWNHTAVGVFLGVAWLRTRSFLAVTVAHWLLNEAGQLAHLLGFSPALGIL